MFVFDIDFLLNNGLMDPFFPYPMAFCTAFNVGVGIVLFMLAILILNLFVGIYKTLSYIL